MSKHKKEKQNKNKHWSLWIGIILEHIHNPVLDHNFHEYRIMSHPAEQINQINWDIARNNHDEAIASLTRTLKTLKLFLSGDCHAKIMMPIGSHRDVCEEEMDQSEKCGSNTHSCSSDYDYDYLTLPEIPSFLKLSKSINTPMGSLNDTNSQQPVELIVFREPITVLSHKALDTQVCHELTYVCLYNLALSYHLKSFEIDPRSGLRNAHLQKALSLYELSQMLHMKKSMAIRGNALHSMTLVSNLRHIHYELGHTEKVDLCSQHLLSTLMYLVYCGEASVLDGSIDAFYDTLLPLLSKCNTASAA